MEDNISKKSYERKMALLFFLTWGLVFLCRLTVSYLMPLIQPDLNLNNTQTGQVGFVMAACLAVSSIVFGRLADNSGMRKKWIVPLVLLVGVACALVSATSTFSLMLILFALVGIGIGPLQPLIFSTVIVSSEPSKIGRNIGLVQMGLAVIALAIGPTLCTFIASKYGWNASFLVVGVVTVVIGLLLARFLKEVSLKAPDKNQKTFGELFKYRNIVLCILISIFGMAGYWGLMIFAPLYLVNISQVTVQQMGFITSLMGIIFIVYSFIIPKLSDNLGHKPVTIIFFILCMLAPLVMYISQGMTVSIVVYVLFGGIPGAMFPLYLNLIPMSAAPDYLKATAGAVILAAGEFIGGAIFPVIAGNIADTRGLPFMMFVCSLLFIVAVIFSAMLVSNKVAVDKKKADTVVS